MCQDSVNLSLPMTLENWRNAVLYGQYNKPLAPRHLPSNPTEGDLCVVGVGYKSSESSLQPHPSKGLTHPRQA